MASNNPRLTMTPEKMADLLAIYHNDGYQVLLDIMESICDDAENEFLNSNPADYRAIIAAHNQLQAQRVFMQRVIARVDQIAEEKFGVKKDNQREQLRAALMSALPIAEELM